MPPRSKVEIPPLQKPELGVDITIPPEFVTTGLIDEDDSDSDDEPAVVRTNPVDHSRLHVYNRTPTGGYDDALRFWVNRPNRGSSSDYYSRLQSQLWDINSDSTASEDEEEEEEEEEEENEEEELAAFEKMEALRNEPFMKRPYDDSDDETVVTDIDIIRNVFGFSMEPVVCEPKPDNETINEREHRRDRRYWATLRSYTHEVQRRLQIKRARNDTTQSDTEFVRSFQE